MLREDRIPRCPHCAKPLQPIRYGIGFGPRATLIIDTIEQAGFGGISSTDLFNAVYRDRDGATPDRLRSYIGAINAALVGTGVAIRAYQNHYRITGRT